MINIAIVDDDDASREILSEYVEKYKKEADMKIRTFLFPDGLDIVDDYKAEYDIIFLDVKMKFLDGMKTAEKIRQLDSEVILIFITNLANYALKGYEVQAMNYLIKPTSYFVFTQELKKALARLKEKTKAFFYIRSENGVMRLNVGDIIYVESNKHRIIIHTESESYDTRDTMKNVEGMLARYNFVRAHNSFLVNLKYVESVVQNTVIVNGEEIMLSVGRKKEFLNALTDYIGREI